MFNVRGVIESVKETILYEYVNTQDLKISKINPEAKVLLLFIKNILLKCLYKKRNKQKYGGTLFQLRINILFG